MIVRKLDPTEHGRTRRLWEEVFTEDTKEFLDYYYFVKARGNQIYTVEEDEDIRSMLQLNPYKMRIGGKVYPSFYIIAVATQKVYRGRGYMGTLLCRSMQDMYRQKVPFTFLMPAAEAIYTPYDFRYIYTQTVGILEKEKGEIKKDTPAVSVDPGKARDEKGDVCFSDAMLWEAGQMADFFSSNFEERWQVYADRDDEYYRTMILEQQSERGGVRLIRDGEVITGMFSYAGEEGLEVREPLYLPQYEEEFLEAVRMLRRDSQEDVRVYASPSILKTGSRPLIMARIICLQEFLSALTTPEEAKLECSFAVIDTIITQNSRIFKLYSSAGESGIRVRETEDSEGVLPVAELTELLFGRMSIEEIKKRPGVILTDHLETELKKIVKLANVFLNEVV